jgi:hypothetical protein
VTRQHLATGAERERTEKIKEMILMQMKKTTIMILAAGLLFTGLILGTAAFAADKNACSEDIAKFCQNIEPGMIALMDCLERHENELTAACKAYEATLEKGKAERREMVKEKIRFRQACLNDMTKFCSDANPTQGGLIKCLNDHEKEISAACSESIKMMVE